MRQPNRVQRSLSNSGPRPNLNALKNPNFTNSTSNSPTTTIKRSNSFNKYPNYDYKNVINKQDKKSRQNRVDKNSIKKDNDTDMTMRKLSLVEESVKNNNNKVTPSVLVYPDLLCEVNTKDKVAPVQGRVSSFSSTRGTVNIDPTSAVLGSVVSDKVTPSALVYPDLLCEVNTKDKVAPVQGRVSSFSSTRGTVNVNPTSAVLGSVDGDKVTPSAVVYPDLLCEVNNKDKVVPVQGRVSSFSSTRGTVNVNPTSAVLGSVDGDKVTPSAVVYPDLLCEVNNKDKVVPVQGRVSSFSSTRGMVNIDPTSAVLGSVVSDEVTPSALVYPDLLCEVNNKDKVAPVQGRVSSFSSTRGTVNVNPTSAVLGSVDGDKVTPSSLVYPDLLCEVNNKDKVALVQGRVSSFSST
eukprot:Pgem_evm1s3100